MTNEILQTVYTVTCNHIPQQLITNVNYTSYIELQSLCGQSHADIDSKLKGFNSECTYKRKLCNSIECGSNVISPHIFPVCKSTWDCLRQREQAVLSERVRTSCRLTLLNETMKLTLINNG